MPVDEQARKGCCQAVTGLDDQQELAAALWWEAGTIWNPRDPLGVSQGFLYP